MDANKDKRGFYGYITQRRKVQEGTASLIRNMGRLVTINRRKLRYLTFLPQTSLATTFHTPFKWMGWKAGTGGALVPCIVNEDQVGIHLRNPVI